MISSALTRALCCALAVAGLAAVASEAVAQDQGVNPRRIVLLPVEYGGSGAGEEMPPIANFVEDIETGLSRSWSGEVVAAERLVQLMEGTWVLRVQQSELQRLEDNVAEAVEAFYADGGAAAIPLLEKVVSRADELLPHVSADPKRAELLLKAHLFLWWSFRQVGEEAQLATLMAATAERFPSAVVSSTEMPPYVTQAFNQARERQRSEGVSLSVYLTDRDVRECRIFIDGFPHGDGRSAGLAVRPGRTYYVLGQCGEASLPPRRVVVEKATSVYLNMVLAERLTQRSAWTALTSDAGPDAVGDLTDLAVAGGTALAAGQVVLASVTESDGGPVLQLDRISTTEKQRICSVRLPLGPEMTPGDIDAAVRAIVVAKPTPTSILFAGQDQVYRTPDEYVDFVTDEGIHRIFTWVTLGIATGALVTASALELVATSDQNNLTNCVKAITCRGTRETEDLRNELNDTLVTRDVLYVTSAVFGVASIILYFVEAPDPDDYLAQPGPSSPSLTPWVGLGAAGANLKVDF